MSFNPSGETIVKHFLLGVLATIAIIAIGSFAYLRMGLAEVRGDLPPPGWRAF